MIGRVIARALMALPPVRAAVRWLGDVPAPTFEQRVGDAAERLRARGYSAIAALAAAEAIEIGRDHGMRYDRIQHDEDTLRWYGVYETGPHKRPTVVLVPLEYASEAEQTGIGSLN